MENCIDYQERAAFLKALAHPVRLQIVHSLLTMGCRNVGGIEKSTGMSQSCISQHLQRLRAAGAVIPVRSGTEVYYHASTGELAQLVAALMGEEAERYVL